MPKFIRSAVIIFNRISISVVLSKQAKPTNHTIYRSVLFFGRVYFKPMRTLLR